MNKLTALTVLLASTFYGMPAFASQDCDYLASDKTWINTVGSNAEAQDTFFTNLQTCLQTEGETYKYYIDTQAISYVIQVVEGGGLDKSVERKFAPFLVKIIKSNAEAGFAPSQHNYAVFQNNSQSVMAEYVKQDYAEFMRWTRLAAAQGEPRAVFNLAMRLGSDKKIQGIQQDPELAYILLTKLRTTKDPKGTLKPYQDIWKQQQEAMGAQFTPEQKTKLEAQAANYKYAQLGKI